ncbi:hypothetical protein GGH95_003934, partial [Coemansia sp. RSA 1836]
MKAVSNLRTRMRLAENSHHSIPDMASSSSNSAPSPSPSPSPLSAHPPAASAAALRRRACTSTSPASEGVEASAFLSPPLAGSQLMRRAWTVGRRKLRGLHPAPLIVYVRENAALVAQAMDRLYATLVAAYNVDSKDIRVADVPTAYDLPSAVRRMAKDRQPIVVVALLTRDKPWFDEAQTARVRDFLLSWSQACAVPLIDGVLVDDDAAALARRIAAPAWSVAASDDIGAMDDHAAPADDLGRLEFEPLGASKSREPREEPGGHVYGQYLAHRAIEMFYIEHRG